MRALFVAPYYPSTLRSGGHTRLSNLVKGLGARHEVHWLSLTSDADDLIAGRIEGLQADPVLILARNNETLGAKLWDACVPRHWPRSLSRCRGYLNRLPREVIRMDFPELSGALKVLLKRTHFDVVQLEYTAMAQYARVVRSCSPNTALVLEEIDVSYLALERRLKLVDQRERADLNRQFERMKQYEQRRWGEFDAVVTMSEEERLEVACGIESSRVRVVPNGVDTRFFSFKERQEGSHPRILFFGSLLHPPNRQGLQRFLAEIWPKLIGQIPLARLEVVGEGASAELIGHDSGTVNFHGFVPDLRPFLAEASLLVVPIWTGSGTRLKVLEAFASGLPVVSTRFGCKGLGAKPGKHFLAAETPADFLKRISELESDPGLGRAVAAEARLLVETLYDWEAVTRRAESVWEEVARRPSAKRH